jgi:outer membrane protein assembly factor BamB
MRSITVLTLWIALIPGLARGAEISGDPLDNWSQWRGPLATGVAPRGDPPIHWDAKTNIKWQTPLPGSGSATPIVWGNQVFVVTAIDTGRMADPATLPKTDPGFVKRTTAPNTYYQFVVLCIDRDSGKIRWQQVAIEQVPHEGHHQTHSYAAGSPTTDGKNIYVSFGSRGIYCYTMDGKLVWQRDLGRMNTRLGWGEAVTPTLYGDALIVNWDQEAESFIMCLDAGTGKTRWKVDRDEATTWNTPLVVPYHGRTQVIVNGTKRVRSYDLANGELIWQCGGQTVNPIPSPVLNGGTVICMSGYKSAAVQAIPLDSVGDITDKDKLNWHYTKGTPYVPSPLLTGDRLYFTQQNSQVLTCLDAKTGKALIDRERLPGVNSFYASPVAAKDRIYFVSREGTTLVLNRSDKLEVLATNRLDDPMDASPAIVGRQLFLRGAKYLYCIAPKD